MALIQSPSISTNGLIFYYDRFNRKKSWKGAPTTNIFATNLIATDSIRVINNNSYYGTYNGWTRTGVSNDNPRTVLFNGSISVASSTFYTLSCLYWSSNSILDDVYLKFSDTGWPESTFYIQPFSSQSQTRNGNFSVIDLGAGWKYCSGTFQTLSTTTTLEQLFFDVDVVDVQVFITNVQLEQQSFATPFVVGTRSNTQAILDLTNNNTITAISLTYASDGTFSFNGTSNYINTSVIGSYSSYTIEMWCKINGTTGTQQRIFSSSSGGTHCINTTPPGQFGFHYNPLDGSPSSTGAYTGVNVEYNTWYHIVATNDSTNSASGAKIYLNGELKGSQEPAIALNGNVYFGSDRTVSLFSNSTISIGKIYNRALTAAEVLQNFNALRGRFGL